MSDITKRPPPPPWERTGRRAMTSTVFVVALASVLSLAARASIHTRLLPVKAEVSLNCFVSGATAYYVLLLLRLCRFTHSNSEFSSLFVSLFFFSVVQSTEGSQLATEPRYPTK